MAPVFRHAPAIDVDAEPRPAALVVSGNAVVRDDWARQLEDEGFRAVRCAGPLTHCALETQATCPLHAQVRFAVYDKRSLTPRLLSALLRHRPLIPILVARDQVRGDGHHEPMLVRTAGPAVPLRWALATENLFGDGAPS